MTKAERKRFRILIVDDKENWRDLLTEAFLAKGYQVETAANFQEARSKISAIQFDIGVFDVRLGDDNPTNVKGLELIGIAKNSHPNIVVVVLTGFAEDHHKKRALEYYNADAYWEKSPNSHVINIPAFMDDVESLLASRHS